MANLFASLNVASSALNVFDQALEVTSNNVTNASTPGYARQRASFEALPFDPAQGNVGGVTAGEVQSARDEYAESQVRSQVQAWGGSDQEATSLAALEAVFPVADNSGIASALNDLYSSLSQWSTDPNDASARQSVLASADGVARGFRQAAADLAQTQSDVEAQIRAAVNQINTLGSQLQQINQERLRSGHPDAGLDARLHSTLENLAEWVDFTASVQPDGSVTVLLGGQTPLVIGGRSYTLSTSAGSDARPAGSAPPAVTVRSADGADITAQISSGRLGGLLDVRNRVLPSYLGDANQPGDLNRLAKGLADQMNQILEAGWASDGPPPVPGTPLFSYDTSSDAAVAQTVSVNSDLSADQLAAIDPGPPYSSNGTALKLADLATQSGQIDGQSFTGFYGELSARAGREVAAARESRDAQQQLVAQARSLRDEISGVSLDEEAACLMQFQRSYQAVAKMVSVLDDLTQTTINMASAT
ncbi:MAG TPA: flagellar hook-associated protein FlgK [Bryobacteraceae bacterium]|nr:flagellar hook-associated protein FlgK [Bryobacteraceae bacterium]